jgi:hypothetical protein
MPLCDNHGYPRSGNVCKHSEPKLTINQPWGGAIPWTSPGILDAHLDGPFHPAQLFAQHSAIPARPEDARAVQDAQIICLHT